MKLLLLASAGGAIGAGLRFVVNQAFAGPQIVGGALVFLASSDSDFVTGQVIAVDGGAVNT